MAAAIGLEGGGGCHRSSELGLRSFSQSSRMLGVLLGYSAGSEVVAEIVNVVSGSTLLVVGPVLWLGVPVMSDDRHRHRRER